MKSKRIIGSDGIERTVVRGKRSKKNSKLTQEWDGSRSKNSHDHEEVLTHQQRKKTLLILFAVGLFSSIGVFWGIMALSPEQTQAISPIVATTHDENDLLTLVGPSALAVAKKFAFSKHQDDRFPWVLAPEKVKIHLKDYPQQAIDSPAKSVSHLIDDLSDDQKADLYIAHFPKGETRLIYLKYTDKGYRVDWDCYARYGTASWKNILTGKSPQAVVRVQLQTDHYYTYDYRDESVWMCYKLINPDMGIPIYGYVKKGSQTAEILQANLSDPVQAEGRVIIRLTSTDKARHHHQFQIERVLATGWHLKNDKDEYEDHWKPSPLNEDSTSQSKSTKGMLRYLDKP